MALNYPPFVVLTSHFRVSGNPNPPAQTLQAEDQQLFTAFNALAAQAVTQAQLSPEFLPLVVLLASMSPGSAPQRVQLATLFVRNALFVLNRAAPPVASVAESARGMAPSNRAAGKRRAEGGWRRPAKKAAPSKKAGTGKKTGAVKSARSPARRAARKSKGRGR